MSGRSGPRVGLTRRTGPYKGQFPVILRPRMHAVQRGVGMNLARAFREGA